MNDTPDSSSDEPQDDSQSAASAEELTLKLAELGQQVRDLSATLATNSPQGLPQVDAATRSFIALFTALNAEPGRLASAQMDLMRRLMGVLQEISEGTQSEQISSDHRFSDKAWSENPLFDYISRTYAALSGWMAALPETTPGLSQNDRAATRFYMEHIAAALSPSNYLMTNPRALGAAMTSQGSSLQRGVELLTRDYDEKKRRFSLTQTDRDAFELGKDLATTPGRVVLQNDLIELIRYDASTDQVRERPILIFPPWINKYYVLDLRPDNSLVAWLRDQGFNVHIASWRNADHVTSAYDWSDYVDKGARAAIDWVYQDCQQPVNAIGYCIGGALLTSVAARMAQNGDDRLASLSLLAAQTDFSRPGDLGVLVSPELLASLDPIIAESGGVMPGELMADGFNMLRPRDLIWRYVEENYLLGKDPKAFDLLYWNADQTNIPGPLHKTYLHRMYLENALSKGSFSIDSAPVNLADIKLPTFVQASEKDHISPHDSVYRGAQHFGGETKYVLSESGHIAGVVNPPSAEKYGYWLRDGVNEATSDLWKAFAKHNKGSWWPVWASWLHERSGKWTSPPEQPQDAKPAPGDYVKVTLDDIHAHKASSKR